jgi:hypothetical protein
MDLAPDLVWINLCDTTEQQPIWISEEPMFSVMLDYIIRRMTR